MHKLGQGSSRWHLFGLAGLKPKEMNDKSGAGYVQRAVGPLSGSKWVKQVEFCTIGV